MTQPDPFPTLHLMVGWVWVRMSDTGILYTWTDVQFKSVKSSSINHVEDVDLEVISHNLSS